MNPSETPNSCNRQAGLDSSGLRFIDEPEGGITREDYEAIKNRKPTGRVYAPRLSDDDIKRFADEWYAFGDPGDEHGEGA